jgi:hypothetical protein
MRCSALAQGPIADKAFCSSVAVMLLIFINHLRNPLGPRKRPAQAVYLGPHFGWQIDAAGYNSPPLTGPLRASGSWAGDAPSVF